MPVGIIQKNKDWNLVSFYLKPGRGLAGRHHPEEQGLKHNQMGILQALLCMPVGIIQKNKDWNWFVQVSNFFEVLGPVGIIQKNKDWNPNEIAYSIGHPRPVGIIQKNKDWNPIQFQWGRDNDDRR